MIRIFSVCLFAMLFRLSYAQHCLELMYPVSLAERVSKSSLVVEGKTINQISFWNKEHTRIYTSNLMEVYKSFKGASPAFVEIITEGGAIGNDVHLIEPSLKLGPGKTGMFTLITNTEAPQFGKPVFEAYASAQGFIEYDLSNDKAHEPFVKYQGISSELYGLLHQLTGKNYTLINATDPAQTNGSQMKTSAVAAITNFAPTTITAGTYSILTINGSSFGAVPGTINFANADDGGATSISALPTEIISWTPTQIQVRVPSQAGTGTVSVNGFVSPQTLTVTYSHQNGVTGGVAYMTQHIDNSGGGYMWTYNAGFITNTPAKTAFENALSAWRCATYINWPVSQSTSTIAASAAGDGVNIVTFNSSLPAGVLGNCASYLSGCGASPNMTLIVTEMDIQFATSPGGATWQFGPASPAFTQVDFESVTVHELGHGHQLGHVINTADVMHYSLTNGQLRRNLNTDDINGGLAVMVRNANSGLTCGSTLMTPLNSSNCSIGNVSPTATISTIGSICSGAIVNLTANYSNAPASFSWASTGGTLSSVTTQSTTGIFNTAGVYTISLSVTNNVGTNTTSQSLTVTPTPTVQLSASSATICRGQSSTLTATGASSFTWSPGGSLNTTSGGITVAHPTITTTYSVSGTSAGCTSTKTLSQIVSACTGIADIPNESIFSLFPSPNKSGKFTIAGLTGNNSYNIFIVNVLGQNIPFNKVSGEEATLIEIGTVPGGIYYVTIERPAGPVVLKLIVD